MKKMVNKLVGKCLNPTLSVPSWSLNHIAMLCDKVDTSFSNR